MGNQNTLSVDGWRIDSKSCRISRGGVEKKLEPRSMELLLYLADRPDQVISRQEIEDNVWRDRVVGYDALSGSIAKLRKAFEDSGQDHRVIETIPKVGYRLVGAVMQNDELSQATRIRHRPLLVMATLFFMLFAGLGVAWILFPDFAGQGQGDSPSYEPSIAVLAFDNFSDDPRQDYLADGLSEDIITDLAKVAGLKVIARNTSFHYKGRQASIGTIATELGVRFVLEGSVRRAGDALRVNAQLIDAKTGGHVWAERYDGNFDGVLDIQNKIVLGIVSALNLQPANAAVSKPRTRNVEAYDLYLEGRDKFSRQNWKSMQNALTLFQSAVDKDPGFAEAYVWIGRAALWIQAYTDSTAASLMPVIRQATARALALDPNLARAHSLQAYLHSVESRDDEVHVSIEHAVNLAPNDVGIRIEYAGFLASKGHAEQAIVQVDKALVLEQHPSPDDLLDAGFSLYLAGDYGRARVLLERAANSLSSPYINSSLAVVYVALGREADAHNYGEKLLADWKTASLESYRSFRKYELELALLERFLQHLAIAGIPRWPLGIEPEQQYKLNATEIRAELIDRPLEGKNIAWGGRILAELRSDGSYSNQIIDYQITSGTYRIVDDSICSRSESIRFGRESCAHIYRNPDGTYTERNEYIVINPFGPWQFSIR